VLKLFRGAVACTHGEGRRDHRVFQHILNSPVRPLLFFQSLWIFNTFRGLSRYERVSEVYHLFYVITFWKTFQWIQKFS